VGGGGGEGGGGGGGRGGSLENARKGKRKGSPFPCLSISSPFSPFGACHADYN